MRPSHELGIDGHWVAVAPDRAEDSVREYGAMTDDLNAMADWLLACKVDTVALESTGVYWIAVFEVLEQRGLKVFLDRKSTRLNSSHERRSRMPSSA